MAQRKGKIFYIDTNIALDYATQRNIDTISTIEKIKEKKWKLTSSSFMLMEFFDYKKDAIFIFGKSGSLANKMCLKFLVY